VSGKSWAIQGREIGNGAPAYIIAEVGVNHNGNMDMALELVDAAVTAGVDAVKCQLFQASELASRVAPQAVYQRERGKADETQLEMLRRLEISFRQVEMLRAYAEERHVTLLATPFDPASVQALAAMKVPAIKIGSGDLTNLPMLRAVAALDVPVILSTGMSYLAEVEDAVRALGSEGCSQIALLHCTSSYPAQPGEVNLRAMATLEHAFPGVLIGYSDHTLGVAVAIAAVSLGASIIEKHLTLDRTLPGPDHYASLEPREFEELVRAIRTVEESLGSSRKSPSSMEVEMRVAARKSVVAARDLPAGVLLSPDDMLVKRPGTGIAPKFLEELVGRSVIRPVEVDVPLSWSDLQ